MLGTAYFCGEHVKLSPLASTRCMTRWPAAVSYYVASVEPITSSAAMVRRVSTQRMALSTVSTWWDFHLQRSTEFRVYKRYWCNRNTV